MGDYSFIVEHAKSGRATCKGCNRSISKGALRIGVKQISANDENDEHSFSKEPLKWYHSECKCVGQFRKTASWWEKNCPNFEDVAGTDGLKEDELRDVEKLFDALRSGKGVAPKKMKEVGGEGSDKDEDEEVKLQKSKKKGPLPSSSRKGKGDSEGDASSSEGSNPGSGTDSDDEEGETSKKSKKKALSKRKREESESGEDGSDEDPKPKAKKVKKAAPKKKTGGRKAIVDYTANTLNDDQIEKINDVIQQLSSKTLPQLKALLSKNEMKTSGTKADLLERIGESTILGCIPKCVECGANIRWNRDDGAYSCPGKFEEGQMKRCSFKADHMERTPWRS